MNAWYTRMFNADYLRCYAHLDEIAVAQAEEVLACLGLPAGARILDLAGGYGRIAVPLAQRGYRVTVHDLSTDFLRVGRERAAAAGVEVEWRHGDMRDVPATGDYDAVISMFRREEPRSGRYATRSIVTPRTVHATIADSSTTPAPGSDG